MELVINGTHFKVCNVPDFSGATLNLGVDVNEPPPILLAGTDVRHYPIPND